jgi:large subunit ribosomal protein L21
MYAVVSTGGKQYRVEPGTTLTVERLAVDPGATITFDRVLLVGDGDDVTIGTPTVAGATVSATVLRAERGPKLVIFKFRQKVKYRRKAGHRQELTVVRVDAIEADGKSARRETAPEPRRKPAARVVKGETAEKAKPADVAETAEPTTPKARRPRAKAESAAPKAPAKPRARAVRKPAAKE